MISKQRIVKAVLEDREEPLTTNKKLRIAGLPNRRAANLKKH